MWFYKILSLCRIPWQHRNLNSNHEVVDIHQKVSKFYGMIPPVHLTEKLQVFQWTFRRLMLPMAKQKRPTT